MNRRAKALLWFYMLVVFPLACAVLLLSGCATITDSAAPQSVRVVWHRTDGTTMRPVKKRPGHTEWLAVNGYARMIDGVCHVWAPDPPVKEGKFEYGQWGTLGHEVKHCFDGGFHD